ncbi:LOW QUALITY PROTEIN: Hypothetical protein PHPALM_898 [Phytophthora palmivora]|uniref:Uncharacterized protein n=1 Tax=Phytophthora palmivora TaxID=4796 RepID=A0A2P4YTN2_9STRA|nr:LOW QUALITY PROTEIN: Hypothetical protein PHPALM_898 [Phytophthora palmivora]
MQLAIKHKNYCIFIGLALINAIIVHNACRADNGMRKLSRVNFMKQLHLEYVNCEDWEALLSSDAIEGTPSKGCSTTLPTVSDCKLTTPSKKPKDWRVSLCDKHKARRNGAVLLSKARKRRKRAHIPARTPAEGSIGNNEGPSDESTSSPHRSKQARRAESTD